MEMQEIDLFSIVFKFYRFVKKYFFLLAGATLLGIILGSIDYARKDSFYECKVTATANSKNELINILKKTNEKLEKNKISEVAKDLGTDNATVKKIKSIEINKFFYEDAKGEKKYEIPMFEIIFSISQDSTLVNNVDEWLKCITTNNIYIKELDSIFVKQTKEVITKINYEIKIIDSLKIFNSKNDGKVVIDNNIDQSNGSLKEKIQNEKIQLYTLKQEYEKDLSTKRPITIIDKYIYKKTLSSIKLLLTLPFIFLIFAIIFGGIRELILQIWRTKNI